MFGQVRITHVKAARAKTTKGWRPPKRRTTRRRLLEKCGPGAFLLVERSKTGKVLPKFPIMDSSCALDCRGLRAAVQRASQYGYKDVEAKARRLAARAACRWRSR